MTTPASPRRLVLAVVLSAVGSSSGCGVPTQQSAEPIENDRLPIALQERAVPDATVGPPLESIAVWLVRDDALSSVVHLVESPVTPGVALRQLELGATQAEQRQGLRSAIPDAGMVGDATVTRGTTTVELAQSFDQIPPRDQMLAIAQIVLTLTDLRGVGRVQFERSDASLAVPLADGSMTDEPVSADDYFALVSTS